MWKNLTNMLYKKTRLEDTFGVNMLAVADGASGDDGPEKRSLSIMWIFQFELATRKYQTLLKKRAG